MPTPVYTSSILTPGQGITIATSPLALPASVAGTIFSGFGGPIHVNAVWGVVTQVIQTQACLIKLSVTVGSLTAVDICANSGSISALAVGTCLTPVTSFATAMAITVTNGVAINMPGASGSLTQFEIMAATGVNWIMTATTSATNTGSIQWFMNYTPYSNQTLTSNPPHYTNTEVVPIG